MKPVVSSDGDLPEAGTFYFIIPHSADHSFNQILRFFPESLLYSKAENKTRFRKRGAQTAADDLLCMALV